MSTSTTATPEHPILVVDDEPTIREMVAEVLESEGYAVMTAANGSEALGVVSEYPPSLVILDLWMPVLDGPGFARELDARGLDVPIVVMTASYLAKPIAGDIGARYVLRKPFELSDLLDAVETVVDGKAAEAVGPSTATDAA
jgi:two-component system, chemotaxis family, chemotaxis protein CheY